VPGGNSRYFQDILDLVGRAVEDKGIAALRILPGQVDQVFEAGGFHGLQRRGILSRYSFVPAAGRYRQDIASRQNFQKKYPTAGGGLWG
jgi:hypothetical protein